MILQENTIIYIREPMQYFQELYNNFMVLHYTDIIYDIGLEGADINDNRGLFQRLLSIIISSKGVSTSFFFQRALFKLNRRREIVFIRKN